MSSRDLVDAPFLHKYHRMAADQHLRALADAAADCDDFALAELIRTTQPAVWRICSALGTAGHEEDLVQETFLRALRALPTFRHECPVEVWLLSIARRVCADDVRRRQRQRRLMLRLDQPEQLTMGPEGTVDDLLSRLSPDRREAFVLTQMVGLSYDEAALIVGCPVGTIRSRVSRARSDLASHVSQTRYGS